MPSKISIPCLTLIALMIAGPACAALGGTVAATAVSPAQQPMQAKAATRAATAAGYTTHELTTSAGTVVRQFAAADGRVFAVSWSGPSKPDLRELLGTYFNDFAGTGAPSPHGHAQRSLENADLVVQSSGRMRAFSGRAYLPSKLPAGVAINDLR
ncbi:MAG: DUF2844 domain-containing protein [Herminiimonas sp.]|nr:DUF2844 domain-containing protein [Herminiimonas sp.]